MQAALAIPSVDDLPAMVRQAADALSHATCHAEVLTARAAAGVAFDAARRAARLAAAVGAHDSLVAAARKVQVDALEIEALSDVRIAEEMDAAQARGDMAHGGNRKAGGAGYTLADVGIKPKQVHYARRIRDAIAQAPGALRAALDDILDNGHEPTRAMLRRELSTFRTPRPRKANEPRNIVSAMLVDGDPIEALCWRDLDLAILRREAEIKALMRVRGRVANVEPGELVGVVIKPDVLAKLVVGDA